MSRRLTGLALAVLLSPVLLHADDAPPPLHDAIVVTASSMQETLESTPASVTVITRDDIEQRAALDLADVLREVPGLTLSRSGSAGKATSLFTRGADSTHTLVLWNGIELNNPYFSGYDWGRFSTAGVEQVEVVRGPFSALYGSDAVAGVVNVLTSPVKSGVGAVVEGGTQGLRNVSANGSFVSSAAVLNATLEDRHDDGFNDNDDFAQKSGDLILRWTPAHQFTLGAALRYTRYELGIPFANNADGTALVPSPERRQKGNERQFSIPLQQTIGIFGYDLALSESRRDDEFSDPQDAFGFVSSDTRSTVRRARLVTRTATSLGTLVAGGEIERDVVNDVSNFGPNLVDSRRNSHGLFVEDRYSHETSAGSRLELSAGVRRDHFDTFGDQTSPRLSAAWISGPGKFRAGYGQSFRAPSVGELYFPYSGNPSLQAERSHSAELGYDYGFGSRALLSVTLFRNRFHDLIVFDNATYAFANVGSARTQGVELGCETRFARNTHAALSYTFLDAKEAGGEHLLRRPRHSGSIALGRSAGSFDTTLVVRHTGTRDDVAPIAPYGRILAEAYTTADVTLEWHRAQWTPFVRVENLTDRQYEEVSGYRSPGRRAVLGVRVGN